MNKSNTPSNFVAIISPKLAGKLKTDLVNQGFVLTTPAPVYTLFQAKKKGVSCTLYESGKLMVQGKEMAPFIEFYLEPEVLKSFTFTHADTIAETTLPKHARIGIDESGKGDFFGPLCVAGVYAGGDGIAELKKIGVKDSKKLTDPTILKLARAIKKDFTHHIVKINPAKYNELIVQFGNLNKLLAWGHATVIEKLAEQTGCSHVIVDQFADERVVLTAVRRKKLNLDIHQRHRAEEDLVVAAASILARATFVEGLDQLGEKFQLTLPKGASKQTIEAGKKFVAMHGLEQLGQVGKLHFKTLDAITGKSRE